MKTRKAVGAKGNVVVIIEERYSYLTQNIIYINKAVHFEYTP